MPCRMERCCCRNTQNTLITPTTPTTLTTPITPTNLTTLTTPTNLLSSLCFRAPHSHFSYFTRCEY